MRRSRAASRIRRTGWKPPARPRRFPQRARRARYTPVSKRQDRPNAVQWLIKNYDELSDAQIGKLLGTTKATINAVRERTHWNTSNITPQDPILLGICNEAELLDAVRKARAKAERAAARAEQAAKAAAAAKDAKAARDAQAAAAPPAASADDAPAPLADEAAEADAPAGLADPERQGEGGGFAETLQPDAAD